MPVKKKYGRPTPFTIIKPTYKAFTTILLVFCLWTLFYVLLNSDDEDDDENANVSLHGAHSLLDRDEFLFKKEINRKASHDPIPDHHIIASSSISSNVGLNFQKSTTFNFLLEHMSMDWHFWWISTRLEALWPQVKSEAFKIVGDCEEFHSYSRKKIIITPGLLTLTNFASPQTIKNGGSLGELMQWADLVAGCLALCQQVVVRSNLKVVANELKAMSLSSLEKNKNGIRTSEDQGCAGADEVDIIFTDIPGYRALPQQITQLYKYKFRILDVYGTEPAYNDLAFIKAHNLSVGWGGLDLNPKQFYTMFPHTPDNSFLGFMITKDQIYNRHANYNDDNDINNGNINNKDDDKRVNNNNNHNEDDNPIRYVVYNNINKSINKSINYMINNSRHMKQNFALLLGKEGKYLEGQRSMLKIISKYFPLKATMHARFQKLLPEGSELLGIQDVNSYKKLLSSAKVCVGLGDPIESPSPLLALASGCIFLNPAKNLTLFGKPTSRIITSQHPYLERYIKEPHVFTIDAYDSKQLEAVMQRIAKIKDFAPVFPYAFSVRGFLHNLNDRLLGQNFCTDNNIKRSKSTDDHYNFYLADGNHIDCKELCYDKNLICELDHFIHLNHVNSFKRLGLHCSHVVILRHPSSPSFDSRTATCYLQPNDKPIFSCVGKPQEDDDGEDNTKKYYGGNNYKNFTRSHNNINYSKHLHHLRHNVSSFKMGQVKMAQVDRTANYDDDDDEEGINNINGNILNKYNNNNNMKKPNNNQSHSFNNTGKLNVNSKIRHISKRARNTSTTTTAASSSTRKTITSTKADNKVGNKEGFSEHLGKVESSRRNVVEVRNIVERKRVQIVRKPDDNFNGVKHRDRDKVERVSNEENIKMRSRVGQVETRSPYIGQVKRLCPCVLDLYGEVYDVDDDVL